MPIAKRFIEAYLARVVPTLSWLKQLKPLEVEEELSYINPKPKFTAPLRIDQKICFIAGLAYPETLFMTDLGLGKTAVSLELLSYFYSNGFIRRAFVFCPTDELVEGWEDEIKKWGYKIPYCTLRKGSSKKKWEAFNNFSKDGLIIGTYVGIAAMAASIKPVKNKRTGKTKNKRVTDLNILKKLLLNVDAVVYDQSTAIGNSSSLSYKTCRYFSEHAQIRFSLAGRAFGRDPILLWAQFYLTDGGKAFGPNSWMFREAFYRKKQLKFGDKWVLRRRREKIMARLIKASSIRYSVNECISLPPKVYIKKYCEFPEENWTYFEQVKTELLFHAKKRDWREVRNTLLKARQMSSGFVGFIDDASGDRAEIEFLHNPKLDLLSAIIDEVPDNKKCIIFHEFNWSGQRICDLLTKKKLQFGRLWGGTKDWTSIKDAFNNQQDYRFLVANSKKSSMGLNLQVASYAVYYESPIGAIIRAESEGRIHRSGQKHKTFIYDLIVKDSYDELVLEFHREGKSLWDSLVENPSVILKKAA
jgi:hypothetical protein